MTKNLIFAPLLAFAALFLLCLGACHKSSPPLDCYAAIPDTAFVGQPVLFKSCTKGATTTHWNFGDGTSASADSVAHTYTTAGVYQGSLTTSNGQSSTKNFTIVVIANAAGYFTFGGMNYFPVVCDSAYPGDIKAFLSPDSSNGGGMAFGFLQIPVSSGNYTVSSSAYIGGILPGQMDVVLTPPGSTLLYHSSGGNGTQQVYVTVMASRRLNFVGTNIEMVNLVTPYDSFPASFNITMTR